MGLTYIVKDQQGQYFITCTVHQRVDVFTRELYREIVLDGIRYCQQNKGLQVYGWVIKAVKVGCYGFYERKIKLYSGRRAIRGRK